MFILFQTKAYCEIDASNNMIAYFNLNPEIFLIYDISPGLSQEKHEG
jgi:hypothetical protein